MMSRLNQLEVAGMENLVGQPCPVCGDPDTLKMLTMTAEIPYFGEHTQITLSCDECGLRQTDFIPAEEKGALSHTLNITKAEHLRARVVRGSSGTVRLPELDLEVSPGSHSTGYVSNVEGVLQRFIDIIEMVARQAVVDSEEGAEGAEEAVLALAEMKGSLEGLKSGDGLGGLTLEILDPNGHSAIAHEDAEVRELSEAEVTELEPGPMPMIFNASDVAEEQG
jgi:zinc finger protein